MADNPRTEAQKMRRMIDRDLGPKGKLTRAVIEASVNGATAAAEHTPVDRGVARYNWLVGLTRRAGVLFPAGAYPKGSKGGGAARGETSILTATAAAARASAERLRATSRDPSLTIRNNTPYLDDLDKGSSRQSPGGFIAVIDATVRATFRRLRLG